MLLKRRLIDGIRRAGLLMQMDYVRYMADYLRTRNENRRIEAAHPEIRFPPSYLAYDAYSSCAHAWYLETGESAARAIWTLLAPWLKDPGNGQPALVVEWGCGPARILRHLPAACGRAGVRFIGTDYNGKTIAWCRDSIPGIGFEYNGLTPPLPLPDASVDALYCVSVFTHLSEEMHFAWMGEIARVLRPGGIVLMALNGDRFRATLSGAELSRYDAGDIVVRGNVLEGSRTYLAFHPTAFVRGKLLAGLEFLVHETNPDPHVSSGQDIWLARKPQ
jgi:SAM-dependent methyltransferase